MTLRANRSFLAFAAVPTLLCAGGPLLLADVVSLNTGGAVRGRVVASPRGSKSKSVAVRTDTGALIVLDQQGVQKIDRATGASKPTAAAKPAATKAHSANPKLSPSEEAWMTKVRSLVARLFGPDRDQSRTARAELLRIDDPDALPALSRYLQGNRADDARLLFIHIVKDLPGPKAIYYLVAQTMFDRSPTIRDEARKALVPAHADAARPLYIEALKSGGPGFASLAASALTEIGDPNGDAIPYLIDALTYQTSHVEASIPQLTIGPYTPNPYDVSLGAGPFVLRGATFGGGPALSGGHQSMGGYTAPPMPMGTAMRTPFGGDAPGNFLDPPIFAPNAGKYVAEDNWWRKYQPPVNNTSVPGGIVEGPRTTRIVRETNDNPAVLEALVKITKQQFGFNTGNWRRWWQTEAINRGLQHRSKSASGNSSSKSSASGAGGKLER